MGGKDILGIYKDPKAGEARSLLTVECVLGMLRDESVLLNSQIFVVLVSHCQSPMEDFS